MSDSNIERDDDVVAEDAVAEHAVALNVVNGNPTAAEVAAVTVVLEKILEELQDSAAESTAAVSAWQRSQRPIRATLVRGQTSWRSFAG